MRNMMRMPEKDKYIDRKQCWKEKRHEGKKWKEGSIQSVKTMLERFKKKKQLDIKDTWNMCIHFHPWQNGINLSQEML